MSAPAPRDLDRLAEALARLLADWWRNQAEHGDARREGRASREVR